MIKAIKKFCLLVALLLFGSLVTAQTVNQFDGANIYWIDNNGVSQKTPIHVGPTFILRSTFTNATQTAANISGMAFPVLANTNYVAVCTMYYQGSSGSAGLDITLTGPTAPNNIIYGYIEEATATGGAQDSVATAFGTKLTGAGTVTATTNFPATITMSLQNGVNPGIVQIQGSASGNGTVTVQPGSFCRVSMVTQ